MHHSDHDLLLYIIQAQRVQGDVLQEILTCLGVNDEVTKALAEKLKGSQTALQKAIDDQPK